MMKAEEKFSPGLDGIVAAETKISFLDTVKGEIVIQGYDLIELSKTKEYLDIVHLYWRNTYRMRMKKQHLKRN